MYWLLNLVIKFSKKRLLVNKIRSFNSATYYITSDFYIYPMSTNILTLKFESDQFQF